MAPKTLGYLICGLAGLTGASVCLYLTHHRGSYLVITAVVAAVLTTVIIGLAALSARRARHHTTTRPTQDR